MLNISDVETGLQLARAGHADLISKDRLIGMLEELRRHMHMQTDCVQGAAKLFGSRLLFFRTQAGLTRKKLAEKAKVSESGIQRYERGDRVAGLQIQQRLAAALDIPITAFHTEVPETKPTTAAIKDLNPAEKEKLRELIDLTRTMAMDSPAVRAKFSDQTDADDWLFSELNLTKSDLLTIYGGKPTDIYISAAVDA